MEEKERIDKNYIRCTNIVFYLYCIVQFDLNVNYIKEYDGIVDAANDLKISHSTIHKNLKGESKQAADYIWKYKALRRF